MAVEAVASSAAEKAGFSLWRAAFLELAEPNLLSAVSELESAGARSVVVMPYFLTMGIHLKQDLPRLLAEATQAIPGVEITATAPLDGHPALADIIVERVRESLPA